MADRTDPNPIWQLAAILKNSNSHISATHYPIHFVFVQRPYFALGLSYNAR